MPAAVAGRLARPWLSLLAASGRIVVRTGAAAGPWPRRRRQTRTSGLGTQGTGAMGVRFKGVRRHGGQLGAGGVAAHHAGGQGARAVAQYRRRWPSEAMAGSVTTSCWPRVSCSAAQRILAAARRRPRSPAAAPGCCASAARRRSR